MNYPALSTACLLLATTAGATPILTDSFDYNKGPLVIVSVGTWGHHDGATIGEVDVASSSAS